MMERKFTDDALETIYQLGRLDGHAEGYGKGLFIGASFIVVIGTLALLFGH